MDATTSRTCASCASEINPKAVKCPHCRARQAGAPPMHRDVAGKVAAGVCAALAAELGVDVVLVRVGFALAAITSLGLAMWVYALIWFVTPAEANGKSPMTRVTDWLNRVTSRSSTIEPAQPV